MCAAASLTFEQQKEVLMLQLKHADVIKEAQIDKELVVEKLQFKIE